MLLLYIILISMGTMAISTSAESQTTLVDVNFNIMPRLAVEDGVFVEIDNTLIDDNEVFLDNATIEFAFDFNISYTAYFGGGDDGVFGGGYQPENWFFDEADENGIFTQTRVYGTFNLYMDEYDLGLSNYDPYSGTSDTTQDFPLTLEVGWHLLSIVGVDYVSDETHTTFEWVWVQDAVWFYITDDAAFTTVPERVESKKSAVCTATAVASEDLAGSYIWDEGLGPGIAGSQIRPVAEAANQAFIDYATPASRNAKVDVNYNTTYGMFNLSYDAYWGVPVYSDVEYFGEGEYVWWSNDNAFDVKGAVSLPLIYEETNYVFFVVSGGHAWDYYSDAFLYPTCQVSSAVFKIYTDPALAGLGFGILISVSMFGLVAALSLKRFRK